MSLPGVTLTVQDGNLGIQAGSNEHVPMLMGVCTLGTPNTLYAFGDTATMQATLGYGKLVEQCAYVLANAGGPIQVMPITPSQAGALSSVTHTGTGVGTLAVSSAPHQAITVVVTTGGSLGTAKATYQIGSAAVSQPVTLPTGHDYFVPGTYCTITWPTHTYTATESYVFNTDGTITYADNGSGGTTASPTQASSPIDNYNALVTIRTGGSNGTMQFTYSLDNGEANLNANGVTSSTILSPGSGVYAIPNSGVVLTFSGTQTALDAFTFKTASAFYSSGDLASALTQLEGGSISGIQSSMVSVSDYMALSASGWATQTGTLQTAVNTLFNSGIYLRFMNECPTVGSIFVSTGTLTVDSADTDSVIESAAASIADSGVMACAGDCLLTSPLTGLTLRRNMMWTLIARAAEVEASRNPGEVALGGIPGVVYLFRNEQTTPGLDAARFNTLRTFPGVPGFYITDFHTMALSTSDYSSGMNARVIDRACGITRTNLIPLVNSKIPTTTRNGQAGVITEKKAQQIEGLLDSALAAGLVDTVPPDATAAAGTVSRTHNILADGNLLVSVAVVPFAYAKEIVVTIGMAVSV